MKLVPCFLSILGFSCTCRLITDDSCYLKNIFFLKVVFRNLKFHTDFLLVRANRKTNLIDHHYLKMQVLACLTKQIFIGFIHFCLLDLHHSQESIGILSLEVSVGANIWEDLVVQSL